MRTKVQNLSGSVGLEQMECALSDVHSRFFEAKEAGNSVASSVPHISTSVLPGSSNNSILGEMGNSSESTESSCNFDHVLFKKHLSSPRNEVVLSTPLRSNMDGYEAISVTENELLANEIAHVNGHSFADAFEVSDNDQSSIKVSIWVQLIIFY